LGCKAKSEGESGLCLSPIMHLPEPTTSVSGM
jgi:hypothetical protein